MRLIVAVLLLSLATPALAAAWDSYMNGRFGYVIAVPPGFIGAPESDNGDGRVYRSANGQQRLTIWGGNVVETDFAGEVTQSMASDGQSGWKLSYRATTPGWASYSGSKGQRILYVRIVSICRGEQYAQFRLEYPANDITKMNPVVDRLVSSFKGGANC